MIFEIAAAVGNRRILAHHEPGDGHREVHILLTDSGTLRPHLKFFWSRAPNPNNTRKSQLRRCK